MSFRSFLSNHSSGENIEFNMSWIFAKNFVSSLFELSQQLLITLKHLNVTPWISIMFLDFSIANSEKRKRKQMFDGGCSFRWYNQIEIAKDSWDRSSY